MVGSEGVTETPAISPALLQKRMLQEIYDSTSRNTKELDIRSKNSIMKYNTVVYKFF